MEEKTNNYGEIHREALVTDSRISIVVGIV